MSQDKRQTIGDYCILYDLGSGVTGKVKLAQHRQTGSRVAIKIIKKAHFDRDPQLQRKIHREIALMRLFDHPHLLKLVEVCESQNHLYIVLEYAEHGELFDFIAARKSLDIETGMKFFRQIVYGLEFLHSHAICHRDLKPENILLTEFNDVKIGDFGFARWMKSNIAETACGSPHYAAPEVIRGVPYDGRAADIWSCGVILFALLAGRLPFTDPAIRNLLAKVKAGQYVMPDFLPNEIQHLISGMLMVDPQCRATLDQIKEHPAFRIGLPQLYMVPTPLPIPLITEPINPQTVDQNVINVLRQIGFTNDEELLHDFTMTGHSMAKVFYQMLTTHVSLASLPWQSEEDQMQEEASVEPFMVSPMDQGMEFVMAADPFRRRRRMSALTVSSPGIFSLAERAMWADVMTQEYKSDMVQPCVDITLPLEVLMMRMQCMLARMEFPFFHPDDLTLIAKHPDDDMFLVVRVEHTTTESLQMNLFFTQATPTVVQMIIDGVRAALSQE